MRGYTMKQYFKKTLLVPILTAGSFALYSDTMAMKREVEQTEKSQNNVLIIPNEFPGHQSRRIQGTVKVPDYFNPEDYQQDKTKGEGACVFNSMLAGIMHTKHGRKKIQGLIQSQDNNAVRIKFYFPCTDELEKYDGNYKSSVQFDLDDLADCQTQITSGQIENQEELQSLQDFAHELETGLEKASLFWQQVLDRPNSQVYVPKNFVFKTNGPSFPHKSPEWLNLIQQAFMQITKNKFLTPQCYSPGYSSDEEISNNDRFSSLAFCRLFQGTYTDSPSCLNLIRDPAREVLEFFPLVDIPIRSVTVAITQDGLDLAKITDVKATIQSDDQIEYMPVTYNNVVEFAHTHGLTKELLTAGNVIQFATSSHAVVLILGDGKVHYYDNVYYPEQKKVYGDQGPIYQEAVFFQGQSLDLISEEDFFTRLFQEIYYRLEQVARVRGEGAYSATKISFFRKSLIEV